MIAKQTSKHLVFGAGLIGGFVAGGLLNAGFTTAIVARARVKQELSQGLRLTDYQENSATLPPPDFISSEGSEVPAFDVLWLTVKCTAVAACLQELADLIRPQTIIICCQNGLGSVQEVREHFPEHTVLGAVVGYNVASPKSGHLHRSTEGKLVVENHPKIAEIVTRLDSGLFPTSLSDNFLGDQWAKLQLNLTNPVGALSDIPIKAMLEQYDYRLIMVRLQKELLAVAAALDISLPQLAAVPPAWIPRVLRLPDFLFKIVGQKMLTVDPTARFSMWWDLDQNKPTEIHYLNDAVVKAAERTGLNAPVNERIVQLIRQVEAGERSIGYSGPALRKALGI